MTNVTPAHLDDPLDDLFNVTTTQDPAREAELAARRDRAGYVPVEQRFEEGCPKCRGTGKFISYAGRVLGDCFTCKGKGKRTFKTASQDRAKDREQAAARKARIQQEGIEAFKAECRAEYEWLVATAPRWEVAQSILAGLHKYGSLTDKQLGLVRNGIQRDATRAAERAARAADAPAVDPGKIEQAFATARQRASRPGQKGVMVKPLRMTSGGLTLKFTPGSIGSQWEGQLFVKSVDGSVDGKKLGVIKDGKFRARFECTPAETAAVLDCASNPEQAAVAYGKAWSRCSVCDRTLLNDGSIERGIGPICAEKYGW